jgi:hypothetical protein
VCLTVFLRTCAEDPERFRSLGRALHEQFKQEPSCSGEHAFCAREYSGAQDVTRLYTAPDSPAPNVTST